MDHFQKLDSKKQKLCRVELHSHLDGSIRAVTAWELLRKKGLSLPGSGSLEDLKKAIEVSKPKDLAHFLSGFSIFMPAFVGDLDAIERMSYEYVEDKHNDRVLYAEARLAPHLLLDSSKPNMTTSHVVKAILAGFKRGEKDFVGTKVRLILCCMRGNFPVEWCNEVVDLCEAFKKEGVVGIDIAGNEASCVDHNGNPVVTKEEKAAFLKAKRLGIHRTAHAGEDGPASMVKSALESLCAERIGHGYHSLEDLDIYNLCKERNIHFETCPYSSYASGSVPLGTLPHPIIKFCEDGVNFSINTDDTIITGTSLDDEYSLIRRWRFRECDMARANFNAARSCFLPEDEKLQLLEDLKKAYGVPA